MIRVFFCKGGSGEYRRIWNNLVGGGWIFLGTKYDEEQKEWRIRAAHRAWFYALPYRKQVCIALERPFSCLEDYYI